jgi:hypothetical protein
MSDRGKPEDQTRSQVAANQERTPDSAPARAADTPARPPEPPATLNGSQPGPPNGARTLPPEPDRWPLRIGITFLGLIALVCVIALIYLSQKPAPPGTTEAADAQVAAAQEGSLPTQAGSVATQVAGATGTLGLLGQIVGVLATVAAAAVGGIAGFLTASRTSDTAAPTGNTGQRETPAPGRDNK